MCTPKAVPPGPDTARSGATHLPGKSDSSQVDRSGFTVTIYIQQMCIYITYVHTHLDTYTLMGTHVYIHRHLHHVYMHGYIDTVYTHIYTVCKHIHVCGYTQHTNS